MLVSAHAVMLYTMSCKSALSEYSVCTDLGTGSQYLEPILLLIMCACVYDIQDFLIMIALWSSKLIISEAAQKVGLVGYSPTTFPDAGHSPTTHNTKPISKKRSFLDSGIYKNSTMLDLRFC